MASDSWSSLEVAKLGASLVVPVALAFFGVYVHRITKKFEHSQWKNQKLIEKRLEKYDDIVPDFNDLLCYFTFVGRWKEFTPLDIIVLKRDLDKKIYIAAPLFEKEFFDSCMNFQNICFETFVGMGQNARLRTSFGDRKKALGDTWNSEWDSYFTGSMPEFRDVRAAYQRVMSAFAHDIGVYPDVANPRPAGIPRHVRWLGWSPTNRGKSQ